MKNHIFWVILGTTCLVSTSYAQDATDVASEIRVLDQKILDEKTKKAQLVEAGNKKEELEKLQKENDEKLKSLAGGSGIGEFGFGLGFGVIQLRGDADITSAVVDNDVVRVTGSEREKLGIWLTTSWVADYFPSKRINFGPFVGVQLGGNNDIVNSFALGLQLSFRRIKPELPLDFQLGWGWTKIQTLAAGYVPGQAPPGMASQPLFNDTIEDGLTFIVSYNFGG